jgi:CheY-like chemotaxis protein
MKKLKPILLVEDDVVDASTIIQSLHDLKVKNTVVHKTDGEQALEYLQDETNEKPCLILLDLNMPKINGVELLHMLKGHKDLDQIPVVVLTVSKYEQDKVDTFDLGVAGYIIKPVDYGTFLDSMNIVVQYWMWNGLVEVERVDERAKL